RGNIVLSGDENTDGVVDAVSDIADLLISVAEYYPKLKKLSERISAASYELSDCAEELSSVLSDISYDYEEAEKTEERLDLLYRLSKKYNKSEDELVDYLEDAKKELSDFSSSEEMLQRLDLEFEAKRQETIEKAFKLSESRKTAAKEFEKKVAAQMRYLDMPHAVFTVDFKTKTLDKLGLDRIEFLISLNPGEELKPLSSVASGGELSRIMLSIKNVLSDRDFVQTMIFDEIDSGTSGKAASKIGKKLKETARGKQIICITHLAQIAALADTHLLVEKKVENNKTLTSVRVLDYRERCAEIARIMGGENITESTMKAAKEMLDKSVDFDF
ncbi:MAG: DNA repair protein RecN, partial [Acutalibacteraceae bacterium]